MKKVVAILLALASGAGMLIPDPIPVLDEGLLLLILLSCLAYLGLDLRSFFGIRKPKDQRETRTIDVD